MLFADRLLGGDGNPDSERIAQILRDFEAIAQTQSFAETALKLAGKGKEEVERTGAVDRADEDVERLFAPQYQTTASPIHRAVWDREFPTELFRPRLIAPDEDASRVIDHSLEVIRHHRKAGTLHNKNRKLSEKVLYELGEAGYWGMLIAKQYGGVGAPVQVFEQLITRMTMENSMVGGLASVHGCIGAVDPIRTFGNEEQKRRYLPLLASGERLSGFALTEPNAGSDMTALRTKAELKDDQYIVNGEKLFITNAFPGRTIGLVCLIEGKPAVLIADLPEENEHFQLKNYQLTALREARNHGLIFKDFPVPKENLIVPPKGDGLTVAYHGLNLGRISLCAIAAGNMRLMLADMLPWAKFRKTYGQPIVRRELVRKRIGQLAARIVGADALRDWCSTLLDEGYRGEMECIIAKNFGSESIKFAAIELYMRTHGGRSFLADHPFAAVHEVLAPSIFEGERDMLNMAFFKALAKDHGMKFFEPIGRGVQEKLGGKFNPESPAHLWTMRKELWPYARWVVGRKFARRDYPPLPLPVLNKPTLGKFSVFAMDTLQRSAIEVSNTMRKHQLKLPDRQLRMTEHSQRIQDAVVMLVTALSAVDDGDEVVVQAAEVLCDELQQKLTGEAVSDAYLKKVTKLGEIVAAGGFEAIAGIEPGEILMKYENV